MFPSVFYILFVLIYFSEYNIVYGKCVLNNVRKYIYINNIDRIPKSKIAWLKTVETFVKLSNQDQSAIGM